MSEVTCSLKQSLGNTDEQDTETEDFNIKEKRKNGNVRRVRLPVTSMFGLLCSEDFEGI